MKEGNLKEFLSETGDFKSSEGISGSTADLISVLVKSVIDGDSVESLS